MFAPTVNICAATNIIRSTSGSAVTAGVGKCFLLFLFYAEGFPAACPDSVSAHLSLPLKVKRAPSSRSNLNYLFSLSSDQESEQTNTPSLFNITPVCLRVVATSFLWDKSVCCRRKPAESGEKRAVCFSPGLATIINLMMKVLGHVDAGTGSWLMKPTCDSQFQTRSTDRLAYCEAEDDLENIINIIMYYD